MNKIAEVMKFDTALIQALNNTHVTGPYVKLDKSRRLVAVALIGAMAATKTAKLELLQAKDSAGTGAKVINSTTADNAEATVTANADVIAGTVALATVANTDVVTVNGTDFVKAAATAVADNEFADAAGLVSCINTNLTGVVASASGTTVTVASLDGAADVTLGKTENAGTITLATTKAQIVVELASDDLDVENGFGWIAPKVTTTANSTVAVALLRGEWRNGFARIGKTQIAVNE